MEEEQIGINKEKLSHEDYLIIKYEGPSFENRMELHSFIRQINSVEKFLKESISQLNKNHKIKDDPNELKYYIEIRPGSFETIFLILFSNPIIVNILSNLFIGYFKYLTRGIIGNAKYKKEIKNLSENKGIRKATRDIINPCVTDSDRTTIVQGDLKQTNNFFVIEKTQQEEIKKNLIKIEQDLPSKEFEQELIGKILRIDASRTEDHLDKSKLGFVIDELNTPIEAHFNKDVSEEEIRSILFKRIKIDAIVYYKGVDRVKILINDYNPSPVKTLEFYENK